MREAVGVLGAWGLGFEVVGSKMKGLGYKVECLPEAVQPQEDLLSLKTRSCNPL